MCNDRRRYSVTGAIDLFSRKPWCVVSDHPRAAATAALWRKTMLDPQGGVPEVIIQDRGREFANHRMNDAAAALAITIIDLPAFSPDKKPHIERFFRTMSAGLFEELPGYVGHNVAERKDIEARKSFAERFGQGDKVIEVDLSPEELQAAIDSWIKNIYNQRIHSGIGIAPEARAAESCRGPRKPPGERALDILLAPAGRRKARKSGIHYKTGTFVAVELADCVNRWVDIREDPTSAGVIYVFAAEPFDTVDARGNIFERKPGEFHCVARDAALEPLTPDEAAQAKKRFWKRVKEGARAAKTLAEGVGDPMSELLAAKAKESGKIYAFPRKLDEDNPVARQAELAAEAYEPPEPIVFDEPGELDGEPIFEWPHERRRWLLEQSEIRELTADELAFIEDFDDDLASGAGGIV